MTIQNAHLRLPNGWTLSLAEDTPPAFCSVAAWPTADSKNADVASQRWFDFGDGRHDVRCWALSDVCEALMRVAGAPPPEPVADAPRPQVSAHAAGGLWGPDPK